MLGNIIPSGVSSIVCCDIIVLTICCTNVLEVITIRTIAISIFFIKRSKRQTLIPISQNPRTSIHISKIRMPVIYPGIKNSNRCPFASKCCSIYISSSHNIIIRKTRGINSCKRIFINRTRKFHIKNLRKSQKRRNILLFNKKNRKIAKQRNKRKRNHFFNFLKRTIIK